MSRMDEGKDEGIRQNCSDWLFKTGLHNDHGPLNGDLEGVGLGTVFGRGSFHDQIYFGSGLSVKKLNDFSKREPLEIGD